MSENDLEGRGSFTGRMGFVMAAAASAVGLGNLWRFPYLTSHYGGGIFVLVYVILAVTFGFSLMVTEVAIGRRTGKSCISAFGELSRKHRWIGIMAAAIPILIVPYYCVIGGWVTKWFAETATGHLSTLNESDHWWSYVTGSDGFADPSLWFLVFAAMCILYIVLGVRKGIERVSKALMPALFVMIIMITVYEFVAIDGIWDGVVYYLNPDVSKLSGGTFLGAISQIFYSMSLAMGIMITYGSYMKKKDSIEKSVRNISLIDTTVAIMAGLMIIPASFALIGTDGRGMGLMFVTLPQVFAQMPGGEVVAPAFYLLVIFAALTSAVSLLETVVSLFVDETKVDRKTSTVLSAVFLAVMGIIVVLGFGPLMTDIGPFDQGAGLLGILDTLTNSILMPLVAILTCVFVAYVVKIAFVTEEVESEGNAFVFKKPYVYMIKFVCPICLAAILVFGLLDLFGIFSVY